MRTDVSPGIALFASVKARSSQLPLVMAYEPIAMAAEHDATAPHRMYPWLGTVRRYGISRAMEVRSMRTQVTLQPGQKGTKQLLAQYGEQLVCIRYRYDATRQRRLKTVELVITETPWRPAREASKGAMIVGVRIDFQEVAVQRRVKSAGGRWNPVRRLWELRRDQALKLGLKDRIEQAKVSIRRNC